MVLSNSRPSVTIALRTVLISDGVRWNFDLKSTLLYSLIISLLYSGTIRSCMIARNILTGLESRLFEISAETITFVSMTA